MKTFTFALAAAAAALLLGCGGKRGGSARAADSSGRDLSLAPVDSSATLNDAPAATAPPSAEVAPTAQPPAPPASKPSAPKNKAPGTAQPGRTEPSAPPAAPAAAEPAPPSAPSARTRTVKAGTVIAVTAGQEISSKTHKPGQTMTATVAEAITDDKGNTVIPAGATVTLAIVQLAASENKSDSGKLELRPTAVTINGESYPIEGSVTHVDHELKGRGVKAGDAAKVGVGAAAGAILGRVLGGKKKGTVVGGVVGAAAGTAVAVQTADRDVVIPSGAKITISLKDALQIPIS